MKTAYKPRVRLPAGPEVARLRRLLRQRQLHTVCEEARCPNLHECWSRGTATFLILGDRCTRSCRFCNVASATPLPPDPGEAERVAAAVAAMSIRHVVITSVTRDDLPDGGAGHFAALLRTLQERFPDLTTEVLIPDFQGSATALATVLDARPDVLNHNVETVPSLYARVRPQADYTRSLQLLARAVAAGFFTKSGLMVGLGERETEVMQLLTELREVGCRAVTIGQYLQPRSDKLPVARYVEPVEFERYAARAREIGFQQVQAAPLVRSSYHAAPAGSPA